LIVEVVILGRGESLKKLDKFKSDCTDVILVNEFWKSSRNPCDYYKVPEVSKFITGKDITLICTPTIGDLSPLTIGIESEHNVKNKYNTIFAPGSGTDRDSRPPSSSWNVFPPECVEDYKYAHLSGQLKTEDCYPGVWPLGCVRGSLAWAVMLAINYYKADKVTIFGLDFYEQEYLVPQNHNYEIEKKQTQSIKNDFSLLFKFYNKVEFTLHTLSSYNPDIENVTIL
tara:strand:- start:25 stop:705 length:681 start_codon:yes stop_codon:yes gene_type:complete